MKTINDFFHGGGALAIGSKPRKSKGSRFELRFGAEATDVASPDLGFSLSEEVKEEEHNLKDVMKSVNLKMRMNKKLEQNQIRLQNSPVLL